MLFLLPPSETKRLGGVEGTSLDFDALSFKRLEPARRKAVAAVVRLSRDSEASMKALKLGATLRDEVQRNRVVKTSETSRALERYTGVVYDPIGAEGLAEEAWTWAGEHVVIHSALFGLVRATDPIPAYRLSQDSKLPDLALRTLWTGPVSRVLADEPAPIIDLRSEGYAELGPAPTGSAYLRVVSGTKDGEGRRRALNHFNKKTKGTLIARLLASRPTLDGVDDFVAWCESNGIEVEPTATGRELFVVSETVLGG